MLSKYLEAGLGFGCSVYDVITRVMPKTNTNGIFFPKLVENLDYRPKGFYFAQSLDGNFLGKKKNAERETYKRPVRQYGRKFSSYALGL